MSNVPLPSTEFSRYSDDQKRVLVDIKRPFLDAEKARRKLNAAKSADDHLSRLMQTLTDHELDRLIQIRSLCDLADSASGRTAIAVYQQASSLAPWDEVTLMSIGVEYAGMNEFDQAIHWLERALALNPRNERVRSNLENIRMASQGRRGSVVAASPFQLGHGYDPQQFLKPPNIYNTTKPRRPKPNRSMLLILLLLVLALLGLGVVLNFLLSEQTQKPDKTLPTAKVPMTKTLPAKRQSEMETIEVPSDFAFPLLWRATRESNLNAVVSKDTWIEFDEVERSARLYSGRDAVQGLNGRGLTVRYERKNKRNQLQFDIYWVPESFAWYRDRKLSGVWDSEMQAFRKPKPGEAKSTIPERR